MGLSDALRTRIALSRGERLRETIRIFLASKEERRKIAARKFPGRAVPTGARSSVKRPPVFGDVVTAILDVEWYAAANGLDPAAAAAHFADAGLERGLAPRAALAGPDRRHLSSRGAELLLRLRLPLGAIARDIAESTAVAGQDPWSIENPHDRSLAVVTAIASPEDRLLPVPPEWSEHTDFYVVSDFAFGALGPWRSVRPVYHHLDPARVAAFVRTHLTTFFHAYPRVLWIDPDVLCCTDPSSLLGGNHAAFACFRIDCRTPGAELAGVAASGDSPPGSVADFLGDVADHPALDRSGVLDASVLLLDPTDDGVRCLLAHWWRYLLRGPAADRLALTLAASDTQGLALSNLPGEEFGRSPAFVRASAA